MLELPRKTSNWFLWHLPRWKHPSGTTLHYLRPVAIVEQLRPGCGRLQGLGMIQECVPLRYSTLLAWSGAWCCMDRSAAACHRPVAWTAARLCESWWATLKALALILWIIFLVLLLMLLDCCLMWLLAFYSGDFTSDTALNAIQIVLRFVTRIVQTYKIKCGGQQICVLLQIFCQKSANRITSDKVIKKYKKSEVYFETHRVPGYGSGQLPEKLWFV